MVFSLKVLNTTFITYGTCCIMGIKTNKLDDLAGSWTMGDVEADEMIANIKFGWKKWKIKFL